MRVPLVDLGWQHQQIAAEVSEAISQVIETSSFIGGNEVFEFENSFASFIGTRHCVGVASGTDALEIALRALDIGQGNAVVVPVNSFIASALSVLRAGASVHLVDCDRETYLLDQSAAMEALADERIRAVMPVHLYGQIAPMEEILEFHEDVLVIEDAAQSQGATRYGKGPGSFGGAAATSFYPGKNIGAYGDAGAVLTNDDELAKRIRHLGNWGSIEKYHHPEIGFNSRLDTIQAVVLRAKLHKLATWNSLRQEAASRYGVLLGGNERIVLPTVVEGNSHVWHLYVVLVPERDRVLAALQHEGIGAGIHYPVPMHLQGALSDLGHRRGDFPVAEEISQQMLSLPIYPGITEDQQEFVAETLLRELN